ncbi:hypothetical protein [Natrialba asiatica]|uniref:Uncharacterized protein n=1 Tax=Natrialba asiatica (strain ATCC 700177 / DSM 12278 / JCM 9576 / FERM P-10747 / NBRC 102637 / 172P1) TaxID=29540 RepID=M0AII6_NATA1|nr:hypothetical protein [Natrialba asiatica]ELY97203.1 hypothetical protein C481_20586 [Natrialba asiatica DSM 12278]
MSVDQQSTPVEQPPTMGPLARLRPGEVLRCESDVLGEWTWFFAVEDGQPVRYHEIEDYEREDVLARHVAAIVADPDVEDTVVSQRELENVRGKADE